MPAESRSPLAKAIRRIRLEREMSQEHLAHATGLTVGHISRIERGLINPGWSTVERIAAALGVSLVELAARVESGR